MLPWLPRHKLSWLPSHKLPWLSSRKLWRRHQVPMVQASSHNLTRLPVTRCKLDFLVTSCWLDSQVTSYWLDSPVTSCLDSQSQAMASWRQALTRTERIACILRLHLGACRSFTHPTALMHLKKWILGKCIQPHFIFLAPTWMGSHWELL